ncbi:excalibur calcium-binding domain-containing protein [Antribacter sp. KLBMP9083]|uniref:Excalibur calcium-binding domain-containing protein n=2 Tax=Antribacter soli TaxID=2910976 RepID=A0AA41QBU9_9MICO|nr:excalibur calcium-binding domain-containing protein [Antribacter soli]
MDEREAELEALQVELDQKQADVAAREQALTERQNQLTAAETALTQKQQELEQQQNNNQQNNNQQVFYWNCEQARQAGASLPLRTSDPGYRPALDPDNDGRACEGDEF